MTTLDGRRRVKADELEGKAFVVLSFREAKGEHGEYLYTTIEFEGEECVFLCGQQVLMDRLRDVVDQLPLLCCIVKTTLKSGRPCWVFVDPDDPFAGE